MPTESASTSTSNPSTTSSAPQALLDSIAKANEETWFRIGKVSELMNEQTKALAAYENVLQHNPYNVKALTLVASLHRFKENYAKAIEYFQRILSIDETNGEIWGALGNCYLMTDDLQSAYNSYQKSLFHLQKPKVTKNRNSPYCGLENLTQKNNILFHYTGRPQLVVWHWHPLRSIWLLRIR